ncbi:trypsin-like peptidase domain-containing protein [Pontibacter ruber]|uniref:Trypsin-like peptidase domain-containing protein n=1 Tax=Pontibacter ruber TaxID=1343895 RepID=A0ABW5CUT8_9BACT|nr:trypsin-like peptidase domain-containing protein [Pontibacter ruber]
MRKAVPVLMITLLSAAMTIAGVRCVDKRSDVELQAPGNKDKDVSFVKGSATSVTYSSAGNPDFVRAASLVTPAVVHIKTSYENVASEGDEFFYDLFGSPQSPRVATGSGSGVIIASDGYIVTNNHVIESTSAIEVVLPDKRSFKAKLIGGDPSTDLALLKIDGKNFPVVKLGNSDSVQVGEWVLAVGYPLSLNTTVTAGIISAKGRSIGILNRPSQNNYSDQTQSANTAIESFIQTDAAINPGNSGGALVNTAGQLIGINAAIASQTGSYMGYGFAIPVNLMQKVVTDFKKYGEVRRGYLGVSFPAPAVEEQILRERGIDPASVKGVYIIGVQPKSGAAAAGLKEGDIIQSIDGVTVTSSAELSERIARHNPGDKVKLSYLRDGRTRAANVTLKGAETEADVAAANGSAKGLQAKLGAIFEPLPDRIKQRYRLSSGVYVSEVQSGGFFDLAGIPKGTIITRVNGKPVNTLADVNNAIGSAKSRMVRLEGMTPDGASFIFNFPLGA